MKKNYNLFSASLSKVHWTFFISAMVCALGMMTACKSGAANDAVTDSTMLLGKWECQMIHKESINRDDTTDVQNEEFAPDSLTLEMCEFKSDGTMTEYSDKLNTSFEETWDWAVERSGDTVYLSITNGRSTPDYNTLYLDHYVEVVKLDKKQLITRQRSIQFGYNITETFTYKRR